MSFSGPVLALHASPNTHIAHARGPFLTENGVEDQILSDSTSIHGIHHFGSSRLVYGGREVFVSGHNIVHTKDWVLSATLVENHLFVAVMHNRVEIYKSDGNFFLFLKIIPCPMHALLYSAEIRANKDNTYIEVIGGGVMCSMFFWAFSLSDYSVISHHVVQHHKGSIFRIRMSQDSLGLLTTSDDRTVASWSRESAGDPFVVSREFAGHQARVWDAVWLGSDLVATACEDSLVRVFSVASGRLLHQLEGHTRDVRCLAASSTKLWSGGEDGSVLEWNWGSSQSSTTWMLPSSRGSKTDWIKGVHFIQDDRFVVITHFGQIFIVRDQEVLHALTTSHEMDVSCSCVSAQFLFVGFIGGSVELVDLISLRTVHTYVNIVPMRVVSLFPLEGGAIAASHCGDIAPIPASDTHHVAGVPFSIGAGKRCGKLTSFISMSHKEWMFGDEKGRLHIVTRPWDNEARHIECFLISRNEKLTSLQTSESGLLIHLSNGQTVLLDRSLGSVKPVAKTKHVSHICETGVGFTARDFIVYDETCPQFVVNCGGHRRPFDYKVGTNEYMFMYATNDTVVTVTGQPRCKNVVSGTNGDLVHAILFLDNNSIITGNEDNAVRIIDSTSLALTKSFVVHDGSVRALVRIGNFVVSGGARSQLSVFRISDGTLQFEQSVSLGTDDDVRIMGITGLFDGTHVHGLACTSNSDIYLFTYSGGKLRFDKCSPIPEISMSVCLSVATDGTSFYVGCGNGIIAQIGLDGKCLKTNRVHQSGVNAICFVNGLLVSVSDDQSISVTKRLQILSKIDNGSSCSIRAICSDPPNGRIFTTGTDRRLSEWRMEPCGNLIPVSSRALSVTDPLSLAVSDNWIFIGGRGLQSLPL